MRQNNRGLRTSLQLRSSVLALVFAWLFTFFATPIAHLIQHDEGNHIHLASGGVIFIDPEDDYDYGLEDFYAEGDETHHDHEDADQTEPPRHGTGGFAHLAGVATLRVAFLFSAPLRLPALEVGFLEAPLPLSLRSFSTLRARAPPLS